MARLGEYTSCWGVMGKGWAAFRAGLVVEYQAVGTCPCSRVHAGLAECSTCPPAPPTFVKDSPAAV